MRSTRSAKSNGEETIHELIPGAELDPKEASATLAKLEQLSDDEVNKLLDSVLLEKKHPSLEKGYPS